ncbi:MAG TPA: DUF1269 domain-containing protein [Thermomicrobiales bacterium]|nr:DUF1269 domain-containing protein [Thermomicrobiales bacterium]
MNMQIDYVIFAVFSDEQSAAVAASAIKQAAKENSVHISGLASVYRDSHGHVHLHELGDITGSQGAVRGLAAGALLGLIFPPTVLASAAVGGAIGAVIAKFHDKGFKTDELHGLGEELGRGQSAVIFVGDEVALVTFSDELTGADVSKHPLTPAEKDQVTAVETETDQSTTVEAEPESTQ